jgi:hypothetical protein
MGSLAGPLEGDLFPDVRVAGVSIMYPAAGLEFWEVVVASGICAMAALLIASIISVAITYFVMREPALARELSAARERAPEAGSDRAGHPTLATG